MRARTTAAALLGALALVLPTAGTSLAVDHDDDDGRRSLGRLEYLVDDDDEGGNEHRQIRPADNDTCYRLTGTSWENPATTVRNETESLAVLFRDRDCGERAERVLEPGQRVHGVQVRSVLFKPVDDDNEGRHEGRQDGWGDGRGDERGDGRGDGRGDDFGNGDEDRGRHDARPGLPGAPHHNATKPAVRPSVKPRTDGPGSQQAGEEQARDEQPREDQAREDQPREDQAREDQAGDQQARDEQAQREDQARQDQIRREEQARQEEARRDDQARQEQQARDEQRMRDEQARQEEEQGRPAEQGPDMFDRIFRSIG
ncbi:hypothetical protein ABZ934_06580 [Streptomyces sp. NPDC046557]|uniref:hypothetical protein n=1 Tax=Streptomyces sp. NPDC046557 TaxID=3155372 RepID=UPI0033F16398